MLKANMHVENRRKQVTALKKTILKQENSELKMAFSNWHKKTREVKDGKVQRSHRQKLLLQKYTFKCHLQQQVHAFVKLKINASEATIKEDCLLMLDELNEKQK